MGTGRVDLDVGARGHVHVDRDITAAESRRELPDMPYLDLQRSFLMNGCCREIAKSGEAFRFWTSAGRPICNGAYAYVNWLKFRLIGPDADR